jgi:hypothetical protein
MGDGFLWKCESGIVVVVEISGKRESRERKQSREHEEATAAMVFEREMIQFVWFLKLKV